MSDLDTFAYCQNADCNDLTDTKKLHKIDITVALDSIDDAFTKYYCPKCYNRFMMAMGRIDKLHNTLSPNSVFNKLVEQQKNDEERAKNAPRKKVIPYYDPKSDKPNYSSLKLLIRVYELEKEGHTDIRSKDINLSDYSNTMLQIYLRWLSNEGYLKRISNTLGTSKYTYETTEKGRLYVSKQKSRPKCTDSTSEFQVINTVPYKLETPDRSYGARS